MLALIGGLTRRLVFWQVHDSPEAELSTHFDAAFAFMQEAIAGGGGVLVHCFAGRSRSVTVLLAFLMRQQHLTLQARPACKPRILPPVQQLTRRFAFQAALAMVHAVRPFACPNQGFMRQLVVRFLLCRSAGGARLTLPHQTGV